MEMMNREKEGKVAQRDRVRMQIEEIDEMEMKWIEDKRSC